ncbi:MAG: SDR family oxidoreductase [Gammaproteobacteria bacterium]|nr:SDR family oxidoreductase [Gammaproteobacteria bacterium]
MKYRVWFFALLSLMMCLPALQAREFSPDSPTVLVTGSNRGIGLGFVEHYAAEGWNVIATCRKPQQADELKALQQKFPQIAIERLDVMDHDGIDALAKEYEGQPIDLLINNAAVLGDLPSQSLEGLDFKLFEQVMAVNVYGPLKVSQAFADHVAASQQKKIVALTSGLGSVKIATRSRMSGFYYYRISKAGLNMGMMALRKDLAPRGITVGLIAPGMVGTQLLDDSGYRGPSLTPEQSVDGMAEFLTGLSEENSDEIMNTDGKTIPW